MMTNYEKMVIKLKMIELTQNQTMIALTANQIGTPEAANASIIANEVLELSQVNVEELLGE